MPLATLFSGMGGMPGGMGGMPGGMGGMPGGMGDMGGTFIYHLSFYLA